MFRATRRWQTETERLILREPRRGDALPLADVYDDEVLRAQGWTSDHRRNAVVAIARGAGRGEMVVVCTSRGLPIGTVSIDPRQDPARIGLILGPEGRGRGFGLEAMRGSLPYFASRGFGTLILETAAGNQPMRRIAERLGGVLMGEYLHELPNGEQLQAVRYALPPQPAG